MSQKLTILFDLDGTLVDTAPDLMYAHNYVMKKFGYETKSTDDIRKMIGQGAKSLIGRSVWGQAKKEFSKIKDKKITDEMVKDFIKYYCENIQYMPDLDRFSKGLFPSVDYCAKIINFYINNQDLYNKEIKKHKTHIEQKFNMSKHSERIFDFCEDIY